MSYHVNDKIKMADNLSQKDFKKLLTKLDDKYHNKTLTDEENISDETYDLLLELYVKKYGEYKNIGAPVPVKFKEILPKYLGSLDKIRTSAELSRWMKKYSGPYVITDKVDGVSAVYGNNKLYTRGDGYEGTNISHIIKYLNFPKSHNVYSRCEIYIPKDVFEKKYKNDYSNTRNMVTGILNPLTKIPNIEVLKDLRVVSYEYDDETYSQSQSQQLDILENIGFDLPYKEVVDDLTIDYLDNLIRKRKTESNYDMDGLVIVNDVAVKAVTKGNPANAIAFKIEGEVIITSVKSVEWNASKHGVLKPRVNFDEVVLGGVKINWSTGFNAKFIMDNKIGYNAKIKLTRSGDVIPYIKEVVEQADEADMPDEEYEWNETGVDIVLIEENDDVKIRKIVEFFDVLDAKFVGKETIKKLFENGLTTLQSIFDADVEKLIKIEGIQTKSAQRIADAIKECIYNVPLAKLSAASGTLGFGFGKKNMELVLEEYPDILQYYYSDSPVKGEKDQYKINFHEMSEMIIKIKGFSDKRSSQFSKNFPKLKEFIHNHPMITIKTPKKILKKDEKKKVKNDEKKEIEIIFDDECDNNKDQIEEINSLDGKIIVFTGVRDPKIEEIIQNKGGKVTTSVSGKTDILVVGHRYSGSSKEIKAEQLGKEILNIEDFKKKYI